MSAIILVDANNIGFIAAANKHRLSAGDIDTTAIYGFLQILRKVSAEFKGQMTVLHDGRSWRHAELDTYKEGREASQDAIDMRACWKASKPWVGKLLRLLGVNQVLAPNLEADDLAARLRRVARRGTHVTLISSDKDWLQLIEPNVMVYNTIKERLITPDNFLEMTGLPHPRCIAERKALMGKTLEMPGVGGIGEKTANGLLTEYGSVDGFLNAMGLDKPAYDAADRRARTLVDDEAKLARFRQNMRLAWLDHPDIPAAEGSKAVKGAFDRDAFLDLCAELSFFSIVRDADRWLAPFTNKE